MYRTINFSGEKEKLIALIAARTGTLRSELTARSIPELEQLLNESLLAQIRAEAQNSPAAIEAEQKLREYQISDTQANFYLTVETLGSPLDAFQIGQAAKAGTLLVSPAAPTEVQEWTREAEQQRQQALRNMSPEELRGVVRQEAEQRRAQALREDAERQIAHREMLDAQFGYPSLPETNHSGEKIDAAYLTRISNTDLDLFKRLIRMYGAANVTARLRGIR